MSPSDPGASTIASPDDEDNRESGEKSDSAPASAKERWRQPSTFTAGGLPCVRVAWSGPESGLACRSSLERRVVHEDRPLEPLQLLARLQAKLLSQCTAGILVDGKCFCLPARAVKREHELAARPFA